MSRPALVVAAAVLLLATGCRVEERPSEEDPPPPVELPDEVPAEPEVPEPDPPSAAPPAVLEVGDAFWAGPGTTGAELVGSFVSPEALAAVLDRSQTVARDVEGRSWRLGDILVSMEFLGPGETVIWRVAGPREVISRYLERIREAEGARERGPVRELAVLPLEIRPCCPVPPEER
jgi:hypothetical protein